MWFRSTLSAIRPSTAAGRSRQGQQADRRRQTRRLLLEPLDARLAMAFSPFSDDTPTLSAPVANLSGDFTGDGLADLVVVSNGYPEPGIQLFVATGGGDFAPPANLALTGLSVAAGDLNADGNLDLVIGGKIVPGTGGSLALGNGDGTFQPPIEISLPSMIPTGYHSPVPQFPGSVAVGDFNSDGTLDLMVTGRSTIRIRIGYGEYNAPIYNTYTSGHVNVLLGNGDGTLEPAVVSSFPGQSYGEAAALAQLSDDNGDGVVNAADDLDLLVRSGDSFVLRGQGNGSLSLPTIYPFNLTNKVVLGDFDQDGQLDLLTLTGGDLGIIRGLPGGAFAQPTPVNLGGPTSFPRSVAVGDIDGDGKLDIAVTTQRVFIQGSGYYDGPYDYGVGTVHDFVKVILGHGDGTFSAPITNPLGVYEGYSSGGVHLSLLADVDGDDRLDLALVHYDLPGLTVALNDGLWVPPVPPVSLRIEDVEIVEGDSGQKLAVFTVTARGDHAGVSVEYTTQDDTATAGQDYTATSGTLTFAAGQDTQTIEIPILGDRSGEWTEIFYVQLSNPSGAVLVDGQALVTIQDNEPAVSINHAYETDPLTVVEGDGVTVPAVFTVTLSAPYDEEITVDYYTLTGHTSDIIGVTDTLRFAPGETSKDITIQVVGDLINEPLEAFNVYLSNSPTALVVSGAAYCYIEDNDPIAAPTISIGDASIDEGNSGSRQMTFTVTLSQPSNQKVRVNYATANGTAKTSDNDYVAKSGTITFNPGQTSKTITVSIKGDKQKESDESFFVNLSGASGAPIDDGQGEGWIFNDDGSSVASSKKSYAAAVDAVLQALMHPKSKKRGY
jgi:hypothetical protein